MWRVKWAGRVQKNKHPPFTDKNIGEVCHNGSQWKSFQFVLITFCAPKQIFPFFLKPSIRVTSPCVSDCTGGVVVWPCQNLVYQDIIYHISYSYSYSYSYNYTSNFKLDSSVVSGPRCPGRMSSLCLKWDSSLRRIRGRWGSSPDRLSPRLCLRDLDYRLSLTHQVNIKVSLWCGQIWTLSDGRNTSWFQS